MLIGSIALFAIAALGGLALTGLRVRASANPPMPIALVHGAVAAAGLVTLILHVVVAGFPMLPSVALGLFVIAALGGFVLFATHLRDSLISVALVAVHATAAVVGFIVLVFSAL